MWLPDLMIDLIGCGLVTAFDTVMASDYIGDGPTDVSHDRWGCLNSWLFTSYVAWTLLWTWPNRCLPWIRKNLMCDC